MYSSYQSANKRNSYDGNRNLQKDIISMFITYGNAYDAKLYDTYSKLKINKRLNMHILYIFISILFCKMQSKLSINLLTYLS